MLETQYRENDCQTETEIEQLPTQPNDCPTVTELELLPTQVHPAHGSDCQTETEIELPTQLSDCPTATELELLPTRVIISGIELPPIRDDCQTETELELLLSPASRPISNCLTEPKIELLPTQEDHHGPPKTDCQTGPEVEQPPTQECLTDTGIEQLATRGDCQTDLEMEILPTQNHQTAPGLALLSNQTDCQTPQRIELLPTQSLDDPDDPTNPQEAKHAALKLTHREEQEKPLTDDCLTELKIELPRPPRDDCQTEIDREPLPRTSRKILSSPKLTTSKSEDCKERWNILLQLWSQTDALVQELIAHAKGESPNPPGYKLDGKGIEKMKSTYSNLSTKEHVCERIECMEDDAQMLTIIGKNMGRTILAENVSNQVEERTDGEYLEWKDWKRRHEEEKLERLRDQLRKQNHWNLYRECCQMLEENKTK